MLIPLKHLFDDAGIQGYFVTIEFTKLRAIAYMGKHKVSQRLSCERTQLIIQGPQ